MKIIAFDGYLFESGDYWGGLDDAANVGNFSLQPNTLPRRAAASLLTGATVTPRAIPVNFGYNGTALTIEDAFQKLSGILDPMNEDPRTLTAEMNNGTIVSCEAIVLNPGATFSGDEVQILPVTFLAMEPYWRRIDETTTSVTISQNSAISLVNNGRVRAFPKFEITPITQRITDTASVGWKWQRQVTITNNSAEGWKKHPVCIDLGDTAAWVTAGEALINGDDVRIRWQGKEFNRTLVNFATKRTLCWFTVDLKKSASMTVDVIYGNPSANAPRTMSLRTGTLDTYIAYDLEGAAGIATSGTLSTMTKTGAGWETNRWKDGFIGFVDGTGSVRWRRILSNTSTVITFNRAVNTAPDNTTAYVIWKSGIFMDGGRVTAKTASTMTDDQHTTKWGVNQLEGATVTFLTGSASPATMTVQSNTTETLTFTGSFSVQPAVGDAFTIQRYGVMNYVVDTAITDSIHRGLYRQNRYYEPSGNVWPGQLTPGGWGPDTYLDNDDQFEAMRPYNTGSGGGHSANYWPLPRSRRKVKQTKPYTDEKSGDGFSTYVPSRLQGVYFDYQMKNRHGVGKVVMAYKEPAGEQWQDIVTDSTTHTNITAVVAQYVDLNAVNNPTRLGVFVLPYDGVSIESQYEDEGSVTARTANTVTDSAEAWTTNAWAGGTLKLDNDSTADPKTMTVQSNTGTVLTLTTSFVTQPTVGDIYELSRDVLNNDEVEFRTNNTLILYPDIDAYGGLSSSIYAVGSATAIYDANMDLRIGGGEESVKTPPFDLVRTGGSGHRLHLKFTEKLVIRTDPATNEPFAAVYNLSDVLQYRAGWAIRHYRYEEDIDGADAALVSREFMPLKPFLPLIENYTFTTDLTGWGAQEDEVGVTATWSRDAAVFKDTAGSLKCVIAASPVGDWYSWFKTTTPFDTVVGQYYDVSAWVRTTDTNLKVSLYVEQVNNAIYGTVFDNGTVDIPATGAFYPIGARFEALDTSHKLYVAVEGNGSQTGTVYFDLVIPSRTHNLYVSETAMGTIAVSTSYQEGFSG